jgi:tellurite resistance-related uncharacterized protein
MSTSDLPPGLTHVRTTDVFDNDSVPPGLLHAHHVADGVWGRLVVHSGAVRFLFEDQPDSPSVLLAGDTIAIPPARPHHVELDEPATFSVEFYRAPSTPRPVPGTESSALHP